jgi:hypothetical protein
VLDELQHVVDGLAQRLNRPIAIDDVHLRLLAYSAHDGPVDAVRAQVILARVPSPEVVAYVARHGIARAEGPIRLAGDAKLGMEPRVVVAIRCHGFHFGYLWLVDSPDPLSEIQLQLACTAADEAGVHLYRNQVSKELRGARERELIRDLLSADPRLQRIAAGDLFDAGLFSPSGGVVAIVVQHKGHHLLAAEEATRLRMSVCLDELTKVLPPKQALRLVRPDNLLLLVTSKALERSPDLPQQLFDGIAKIVGGESVLVAAVGSTEEHLRDAALSYERACQAARVGEVVNVYGSVVRWDQVGVYGILASLPIEQLARSALHPAVVRLIREEPGLVDTLEQFLDSGASTQTVAAGLGIHRASVYHRLRRIERVSGLDLADGEHRLAAHLSLKIFRLSGSKLHEPEEEGPGIAPGGSSHGQDTPAEPGLRSVDPNSPSRDREACA